MEHWVHQLLLIVQTPSQICDLFQRANHAGETALSLSSGYGHINVVETLTTKQFVNTVNTNDESKEIPKLYNKMDQTTKTTTNDPNNSSYRTHQDLKKSFTIV